MTMASYGQNTFNFGVLKAKPMKYFNEVILAGSPFFSTSGFWNVYQPWQVLLFISFYLVKQAKGKGV